MACLICGRSRFTTLREYQEPDIYEKYQGITSVYRAWRQCRSCMFQYQIRNYPLNELEAIYKKGYRDKAFRGVNIRQAYNKVYVLPKDQSESWQRAEWFSKNVNVGKRVLDVGSGLGIFPKHLMDFGYEVDCTEENTHSVKFIKNVLKIPCYTKLPKIMNYDIISLVHILEHIPDPDDFIKKFGGIKLFIEVPDGKYFDTLKNSHDDLNSCHLWGFDFHTLELLLQRNGYHVTAAKRVHHDKRNLNRLMMVAQCN